MSAAPPRHELSSRCSGRPGGKIAQVQVAEYEFFYEGQRFLGTSEDWWSEGDELTVMFNPDNPSQNRADGIGPLVADYLKDVFLLGLFAFYAIRGALRVAVARWLTPRAWWVSREVEGVTIEWLQIPGVEERSRF